MYPTFEICSRLGTNIKIFLEGIDRRTFDIPLGTNLQISAIVRTKEFYYSKISPGPIMMDNIGIDELDELFVQIDDLLTRKLDGISIRINDHTLTFEREYSVASAKMILSEIGSRFPVLSRDVDVAVRIKRYNGLLFYTDHQSYSSVSVLSAALKSYRREFSKQGQ